MRSTLCRMLVAAVAASMLTAPARADAPKAAPKGDPVERLLVTLEVEANFANVNLNEVPMFEVIELIGKKYALSATINEEAFRQFGIENFRDTKPRVAVAQLRDLTLRQSLNLILDSLDATYLVRNGAVEVVPNRYAAKVTKSAVFGESEEGGLGRLREPLVSAILKEKPLNEALAQLAERFDLTVVVAPQAADARTGFVTARLLNVPADKAVELLALQCDLRVVRKGTTFLVTSRDHADGLFGEKQDRERQKIELEKFRDTPVAPPKPAEKPVP